MYETDDAVGTDGTASAMRTQYEWSTIPPSIAVAESVALATGDHPERVGPLRDALDPDALDALLASRTARDGEASVSFSLEDLRVTARSDGEVIVRRQRRNPSAHGH